MAENISLSDASNSSVLSHEFSPSSINSETTFLFGVSDHFKKYTSYGCIFNHNTNSWSHSNYPGEKLTIPKSNTNRNKREHALAWVCMKLTDNIIGGKNVRCMIPACDWTGKYTPGVFGMEHHLQSNHKAIWESIMNENIELESKEVNKSFKDSISKKVLISDYMAPPLKSEDYLMTHCALFLYLASYGRPFSIAYNDRTNTNPFNTNKINGPIGFNALLYMLTHGAYAAPCRDVLTKLLDICHFITNSFIKELIISASKFYNYLPFLHLSADLWTSKFTNESFGTIHVHFCGPEGNFEHFCLGVTAIHGSHTSNLLASWINNCLDEFSISKTWIISKIFKMHFVQPVYLLKNV